MHKSVYLCGPIANTDWTTSANGWRKYVYDNLNGIIVGPDTGQPFGSISVYSPMRGKEFLKDKGVLGTQGYEERAVSSVRGIVGRDNNDVMNCDVMLANFLDTEKVSIGSVAEFGLAHAYRKPIVTVMEKGNIHDHIFIQGMSTYIVPTLDEGIDLTKMLLLPGY